MKPKSKRRKVREQKRLKQSVSSKYKSIEVWVMKIVDKNWLNQKMDPQLAYSNRVLRFTSKELSNVSHEWMSKKWKYAGFVTDKTKQWQLFPSSVNHCYSWSKYTQDSIAVIIYCGLCQVHRFDHSKQKRCDVLGWSVLDNISRFSSIVEWNNDNAAAAGKQLRKSCCARQLLTFPKPDGCW